MGDLVSDGESLTCPFCTAKVKLGVSSSSNESDSKKIANTSNHSFSAPGAQCIVVPSAPKPCQPSGQNVDPGQSPHSVDGCSALGAGCKWMCPQGGLITVSSAAQASMIHNGAANAESYKPPEVTSHIKPQKAANESTYKQYEWQKPHKTKAGQAKMLARKKPINLPPAKKIKVDMEHICSGHQKGGARAAQSKQKSTFPPRYSEAEIKKSVVQAYKRGKPIGRQGDRIIVRGASNDKLTIDMWVNTKTKTIETAYPLH